jgi:hypothetical protein
VQVSKDGRSWRIGTATDVDWIAGHTTAGVSITTAIPPVFDAYAPYPSASSLRVIAISCSCHLSAFSCRGRCGQCVRASQAGCWGSSLCTMTST